MPLPMPLNHSRLDVYWVAYAPRIAKKKRSFNFLFQGCLPPIEHHRTLWMNSVLYPNNAPRPAAAETTESLAKLSFMKVPAPI